MDVNQLEALATNPATIATVLAAFSTVHTFLDKHPRTKKLLELAAHAAGPLNLPAMWRGYVQLSKAVVEADEELAAPMLALESDVKRIEVLRDKHVSETTAAVQPPVIPVEAHKTSGTVTEWPR